MHACVSPDASQRTSLSNRKICLEIYSRFERAVFEDYPISCKIFLNYIKLCPNFLVAYVSY